MKKESLFPFQSLNPLSPSLPESFIDYYIIATEGLTRSRTMPDSDTHAKVGDHTAFWGGGGIAGYHFLTPETVPLLEGVALSEIPLFAFTVWIGTRIGAHLPDLIEPPESPNHRGLAHSISVYLLVFSKVLWLWIGANLSGIEPGMWEYLRVFLAFAGISYMSHLHLDAHTEQSIPWLHE